MARLKRANDGHLYILAGQSQGTWQVSKEGEFWLRLQGYGIPEQGEVVDISGGEFAYLKDHKYLYTHGFDYDHNRQDIPPDDQREPELVVSGLPLFLRMNEQKSLTWELALDLAKLNDDAWNELDRYHATFVTVTGAWTSVSQQQLRNTPCLLRIDPKSEPYQLYWENNEHTKQAMELPPQLLVLTGAGKAIYLSRAINREAPGGAVCLEALYPSTGNCCGSRVLNANQNGQAKPILSEKYT